MKWVVLYALICALGAIPSLSTGMENDECPDVHLRYTEDGAYIVGSYDSHGDCFFRWWINGQLLQEGPVEELFHVRYDGAVSAANGEAPLQHAGESFVPGRWGSALVMGPEGVLRYARDGNLSLMEGTIELWLAPLHDGHHEIYRETWHPLFHYEASDTDTLSVIQAADTGIIYVGGYSAGQWQSAFSSRASMFGWKAGEWRHLAVTYSASQNALCLYLDGQLVADSNEGGYCPPASTGNEFRIGSLLGQVAHYALDEIRITERTLSPDEVQARALRTFEPRSNEVWLNAEQFAPGDVVVLEALAEDAGPVGHSCFSDPLIAVGVPLLNPVPASTLLPAGTTQLLLSVESSVSSTCRYSLNEMLEYPEMMDFDSGSGSTQHTVHIRGLNPDPLFVNRVYLRSAAAPDVVLELHYRSMTTNQPSYPRTFNLWGEGSFHDKSLEHIAKTDLWIGAWFDEQEARALRELNPAIRLLITADAISANYEAPEDYYLRDVNGRRIEVWVGCHLLNVTRPDVVDYMIRRAYERTIAHDLSYDGCLFDNVMLTQSWRTKDIYGNPIAYDADEDGVPDDPVEFDAAWGAGVRSLLAQYRRLLPGALMMVHSFHSWEPGFTELFNGTSLGFYGAEVRAGERDFGELWDTLQIWKDNAQEPIINSFEAAVLPEIGYGYGYEPWTVIPDETLDFVRQDFAAMRFGLALTLMGEGYFAYEFSDTWHGNDWWYDELDFDLGQPLGPHQRIPSADSEHPNVIVNSGFEEGLGLPWWFWPGDGATISLDSTTRAKGRNSARVDVSAISRVYWDVGLAQMNIPLTAGEEYEVSFCARSDEPGAIQVGFVKGSPDWRNLGLTRRVAVGPEWRTNSVTFQATESSLEGLLQFMMGEKVGAYWLDDVQVRRLRPEVLRRDFENGIVLLNRSREPRTIEVEFGSQRLSGEQAPRYDWVLDDCDPAFSATGPFMEVVLDSGLWKPFGPYYHDWGPGCRLAAGEGARASWRIDVPAADRYTIAIWWPAAPQAYSWSSGVVYEVWSGHELLAKRIMDQRADGDKWHTLATLHMNPTNETYVHAYCPQDGIFAADAIHMKSTARYNDGGMAESVFLQPLDGIVLRRLSTDIPATWTKRYFPDAEDSDPWEDFDGDGMSNWEEYLADTDPTESKSVFRMPSIRRSDGGLHWSVSTSADRIYTLQTTSRLVPSAWSNQHSFRGTGDDVVVTDVIEDASRIFYRLIVEFE